MSGSSQSGQLTNLEVGELYRRYGHLVLRRCRIVLRDDGLADDALQEVFVKVMRYGVSIRDAESPLRWLYRASDRVCFDALGKRKRRSEVSDGALAEPAGPHPDGRAEARDTVMNFLRQLNNKHRAVAVLAYVDGLDQGSIATELGTSRQSVNKVIKKIRERAERFSKGQS